VGKPLDRRMLRGLLDHVPSLWMAGDVAIRGQQVDGGIRLAIEVTPQPTLKKLTMLRDGKEEPVPVELIPMSNSPIDPKRLDDVARQLADKLHDDGYYEAKAQWSKRGPNEVELVVTSGARYVIDHVEMRGASVKTDELIAVAHRSFADG